MGEEGDSEDRRQGRDRAIHQPCQPRLHDPQDESPLLYLALVFGNRVVDAFQPPRDARQAHDPKEHREC